MKTAKRCNTIWMATHRTKIKPQDSIHTYQQRLHHLDVALAAGYVQRCQAINVLYAQQRVETLQANARSVNIASQAAHQHKAARKKRRRTRHYARQICCAHLMVNVGTTL